MKSEFLHLEQILKMDKWQSLQDSLAEVTGLAILTVDYKGLPITRHSCRRPFCSFVRNNPSLSKICNKCDSRGGLEAVRQNAPYIYLCHCGVVDLAVPIAVEGNYLGALMAGEVRLQDPNEKNELEQICAPTYTFDDPIGELYSLYAELPEMSLSRIRTISDMLFNLSNYIVSSAINKNMITELMGTISTKDHTPSSTNEVDDISSIDQVFIIKEDLQSMIKSAYLNSYEDHLPPCKNKTLLPVFEYIRSHKGENITQEKMAQICHISPSHFSRLFSKEFNETFTSFITRQKIEWAKLLLEKTDLTITEISNNVGFNEPSYFVRTFKKIERMTPTMYRKYMCNE